MNRHLISAGAALFVLFALPASASTVPASFHFVFPGGGASQETLSTAPGTPLPGIFGFSLGQSISSGGSGSIALSSTVTHSESLGRVPLPGGVPLMASGLVLIGLLSRRKNRA